MYLPYLPYGTTSLDNDYMKLKPSLIGDPDIYLGTKLKQVKLDNGVWAWVMSPSKYMQQAVANCRTHLKANYATEEAR